MIVNVNDTNIIVPEGISKWVASDESAKLELDVFIDNIKQAVESKKNTSFNNSKDDSEKVNDPFKNLFEDYKGSLEKVMSVFKDISEYKKK